MGSHPVQHPQLIEDFVWIWVSERAQSQNPAASEPELWERLVGGSVESRCDNLPLTSREFGKGSWRAGPDSRAVVNCEL